MIMKRTRLRSIYGFKTLLTQLVTISWVLILKIIANITLHSNYHTYVCDCMSICKKNALIKTLKANYIQFIDNLVWYIIYLTCNAWKFKLQFIKRKMSVSVESKWQQMIFFSCSQRQFFIINFLCKANFKKFSSLHQFGLLNSSLIYFCGFRC